MAYLPDNVLDGDRSCIVHGDSRMGNASSKEALFTGPMAREIAHVG